MEDEVRVAITTDADLVTALLRQLLESLRMVPPLPDDDHEGIDQQQ